MSFFSPNQSINSVECQSESVEIGVLGYVRVDKLIFNVYIEMYAKTFLKNNTEDTSLDFKTYYKDTEVKKL